MLWDNLYRHVDAQKHRRTDIDTHTHTHTHTHLYSRDGVGHLLHFVYYWIEERKKERERIGVYVCV